MSRRARTGRGWLLLAANLALVALLVVSGQVRPYAAPQQDDDDNLFAVPDHALVVEAKVSRVRLIRQSSNMGLDALGQVRFGPSGLDQAAELEAEVTGTVTATLANSSTEVLSGAVVQYEIPKLSLSGTLTESSPGRYSATVTTRARLSSTQALNQVDSAIASWRTRSRPVYLNHRMATSFGFLDYLANTVFSANQPAGTYELPLDVRFNARLAADNGQPLSGKNLQGRLELPDQGYSETIQVSSDPNGEIEYTRQENVRLKVEGGTLQTLSSPVQLGRLSRQITVVGLDGVAREYKLPLTLDSDNPLVLFWWGELGQKARAFFSDLLKRMLGQPESPESVAGVDPVDLTVGNVYSTYVDLAVPGRGLGISFERTYNSRDDTVGPLGFGWRHSYEMRLAPQEDGSIVEVDEDGTWRWYSPDGSGGFRAPPGSYSTLTHLAAGGYRLRRKGGLTLNFLSDGTLDFLEDPNGNRISCAYGPSGLLSGLIDPGARQVQLFYNEQGRLMHLRDPSGREVTYEYAGEDLAASVDPEGKRTKYTYDSAHQLVAIRDPNGRLSGFSYDSENRARSFSYEQGQHKVVLSYDPAQKKTFVTNGRGYRTEHRYEEIGGVRLVTDRVDPAGGITRTAWDADRNRTSVTDPLGRVTRFGYDDRGNLTRVENWGLSPQGTVPLAVTTFMYEPTFDRLASTTDAAGARTEYQYDSRGNLTTVTSLRGAGGAEAISLASFTYDSSGQLLSATDPNGRLTRYSYDGAGNLQNIRDPLDRLTQFTHDAIGNVLTLRDPLGRTTQFTYDRRNRLTQVTAPDGSTTGFTYDAKGNRTAVTAPGGLTTQYQYDPSDRLVQVTDPASQTVRYEYDAEGNLTKVFDGENRGTHHAYDALDRLVQARNALDLAGRYSYDAAGNRVSETKPDGTVLSYTYDALNRLTQVASGSDPGGSGGQTPSGFTVLSSFTYDTLGRRTSMTDPQGTTAYTYDELSHLTRVETRGLSSQGTVPDVVTYGYDAGGNRTRMSDPDGRVTAYDYDALNRLEAVTLTGSGPGSLGPDPSGSVFSYTYDLAGNVVSVALPNGLTTTYSYDSLNRLTRLSTVRAEPPIEPGASSVEAQTTLLDLTYSYDASGRRNQVSGTVPSLSGTVPASVAYTYDAASRLTGETRTQSNAYAITYVYDKAGNRTEKRGLSPQGTVSEETTTWSVDAANRLTTIHGSGVPPMIQVPVSGTTDATAATVQVFLSPEATNGPIASQSGNSWSANLWLSEGEHTLKVEAKDNLRNTRRALIPVTVVDPTKREFTHDANGNLTEELYVGTGATTRYAYDVLNRLTGVSSVRPDPSSPARPELVEGRASFTYDGEGKRISATEGGITTSYLYDGLLPVLERQGGSTTVNVWGLSYGGGIGGLLCRYDPRSTNPDSRFLFPLYDGSGNILAWTDATGAVISTTTYTAFGEVVAHAGSDPGGSGGQTPSGFGFSTKSFSSATGLSYFGARYYRADLSRWLTPDPLGMVDGPNVYSYVRNNPVNLIDPLGLSQKVPWWDFIMDGYWAGTGYGEYAADWYAQRYVETGGWGYAVGGITSSLWTSDTWMSTASTLSTAWGIGQYIGRSYWQYYPAENPGYVSRWLTRGKYAPGSEASRALNLPARNPGTAVQRVDVRPFEPVRGPRRVSGGTGREYYRGWRFPD